MKSRLTIALLAALAAFAAGVFASEKVRATLRPLTGEQREELVAKMQHASEFATYWREMYAYTPNEIAFWNGVADGYHRSALLLAEEPLTQQARN